MQRRLNTFARNLTGHNNHQADDAYCPDNQTMLEAFEWYIVPDRKHWLRLAAVVPNLKELGIDNLWLPPGCKAFNSTGNGYDIYDLYDLGEFDQKDHKATKWGTKAELMELIRVSRSVGVGLYWDTVLNHKSGGDFSERCQAVKVDPKDRRREISGPEEIEVWTGFTFPGRGEKYSSMKYRWYHFSGIDWDASRKANAIYKFVGKDKLGWAKDVGDENGNYDYLMFADLDYSKIDVRRDVLQWGVWVTQELGLAGMRLDAIKHYSQDFQREFVQHLDAKFGDSFFFVGEYWMWDCRVLSNVLKNFKHRISLFDIQLMYNFTDISLDRMRDLRRVFNGSLVSAHPRNAVTFVTNHDTQEGQALAAPVAEWFIPHAYSLILLRIEGGYPCVFYGDLYGTSGSSDKDGPRDRLPACGGKLARLILARKLYAYGGQKDYFDHPDCIGWTRVGHSSHANGAGLAVILTNSWSWRTKKMYVGAQHAGEVWSDIMKWAWDEVVIDNKGFGIFVVGPRSMGVWVAAKAEGRDRIDAIVYDSV